jgi:D-alanyl-D-alanine dipeptidase
LYPNRSFQRVLCCVALCGCLAAAETNPETNPSTANPTAEESSSWLDTLANLPVLRWFSPLSQIAHPRTIHIAQPTEPCSVATLPEIKDPEALAFENGTRPAGAVDVDGLLPAMARALARFEDLVKSAGGSFVLKSAYRPPAYQEHLQQVWLKWMHELRDNREQGCQVLRAEVGEEFARHRLIETQEPVTSSDHTRGLAFDATVVLPKPARLKRHRISLDGLALLAGIRRPDILRDPVHFKLAPARSTKRA